jgi:hypothetical protein
MLAGGKAWKRGGNLGWPTLCEAAKGGPLFALLSSFHPFTLLAPVRCR